MAVEVVPFNNVMLRSTSPAAENMRIHSRIQVQLEPHHGCQHSMSVHPHSFSPVSAEPAGSSAKVGINIQRPAISCCSKLHVVGCFLQLCLQIVLLYKAKQKLQSSRTTCSDLCCTSVTYNRRGSAMRNKDFWVSAALHLVLLLM